MKNFEGSTVVIKTIFSSQPKEYDGTAKSVNDILIYTNKLNNLANSAQGMASAVREALNTLADAKDLRSRCVFILLDEALQDYEARLIQTEGGVC